MQLAADTAICPANLSWVVQATSRLISAEGAFKQESRMTVDTAKLYSEIQLGCADGWQARANWCKGRLETATQMAANKLHGWKYCNLHINIQLGCADCRQRTSSRARPP